MKNIECTHLMFRVLMILSAAATCLIMSTQASSAEVLEYLFNEQGTEAIGTGAASVNLPMTQWDGTTWIPADNHGGDGAGVSGLPGDRPYSDPSKIFKEAGAEDHFLGGFAGGLNVPDVQNLSALTVQGWFKSPVGVPIGEGESVLIGNLGNSSNDGGWALRTRGATDPDHIGRLSFWVGERLSTLNHEARILSDQVYTETNEWIFFAVTYTAADGAVQFFKGTSLTPVVAAGVNTSGELNGGVITLSNRNFYIGNGGNEGNEWFQGRAFNGDLDNMRVYDSVLSQAELEQMRLDDLSIPEPTSALLLLTGLMGMRQVGKSRPSRRWRPVEMQVR